MIKHAVLYARVSTDEQADKGYSLPSQLELCRKYAERLGFGVVAEFSEDFTGAVAIAERPEGKKLTAMLRTRQADAIIAYCVDRLARDNVELLIAVRMWLRAGIEVHTCDIGRIEDENNIILLIKGWQGSDERKKIAERTSRGRIAKAQSGKVVEHGQALYGYRYGDGCLIIEEEEGRIVRLIFKWYTDGDGDGKPLTLRGIALRLSEVGIPSPRQNNKKIHGPHVWSCQTVGFILTNETYAGVWHYRKWRKRPEERIPVTVPSIIDRGTWQRAQERRAYNKQMAKRNCRRNYLLRGMIRCAECKHAYVGKAINNTLTHYVCALRHRSFSNIEKTCRQKSVRCDLADQAAWDFVKEWLSDKQKFEKLLRDGQREELESLAPKHEELAAIVGMLVGCEKEAAQYARALAKASGVVGQTLEAQIQEVNARYDALCKRRDDLKAELSAQRMSNEAIEEAMQFREDVAAGMDNPDFETKRRILELLKVEVKVKDGKCRVGFRPRIVSTSS